MGNHIGTTWWTHIETPGNHIETTWETTLKPREGGGSGKPQGRKWNTGRGNSGKAEGGTVETQNRDRRPNNGTPEGATRLFNAMLCVPPRIAAILAQAFGHLVLKAGALRTPCLCSIFATLFGFGHGAYKEVTEETWVCRETWVPCSSEVKS